jgi:hypothetical protein
MLLSHLRVSVCITHAIWSSISTLGSRITASSPMQRLLFFLDESTTRTAPGGQTIPAAGPMNAVAGSHLIALDELNNPGLTEYFETGPSTTLCVKSAGIQGTAQQSDNSHPYLTWTGLHLPSLVIASFRTAGKGSNNLTNLESLF